MKPNSQNQSLGKIIISAGSVPAHSLPVSVYRFDIFKGVLDAEGKVNKIRTIGAAYLRDGLKTYTVTLKTFLKDKFYLLPNSKPESKAEFVILTRELGQNISRKYFWNSVGEAVVMDGVNRGLMKLAWDVLADDIYMSCHPVTLAEAVDAGKVDEAA